MRFFLTAVICLSIAPFCFSDVTYYPPLIHDGHMYETGPTGPGGDGKSSELCVGRNPTNGNWYAALKFDVSGIPSDATIKSATLCCYYYDAWGTGFYDRSVSLYGGNGYWDEDSITWGKPALYGFHAGTTIIGNSKGWYGWKSNSFKGLVQKWVDDIIPWEYGIVLAHAYNTGQPDHRLRFYSRTGTQAPFLEVIYELPTPPPTVSGVSPQNGPESGGTDITISGANFTTSSDTTVYFGNNTAYNVHVANSNIIYCDTPSHSPGKVSVQVENSNGTGTWSGQFTFDPTPGPTVSDVAPQNGPESGGTPITISGSNFTSSSDTTVYFGNKTASNVYVSSSSKIYCDTPSHPAGKVSVQVKNSNGTGTWSGQFTFDPTPFPTITDVSPDHGTEKGGTPVTITGSNYTSTSDTQVFFGGTSASSVNVSGTTQITCVTPKHSAGDVSVMVQNSNGSGYWSEKYTYDPFPEPSITYIYPAIGPISGSTSVTITGENFTDISDTTVKFGPLYANLQSVNSTTIVCSTPQAGNAGAVDVIVETDYGLETLEKAFAYHYEYPDTYYVPLDYNTIQETIDIAGHGSEIYVSKGTYNENIIFRGKEVVVKSTEGANVTIIDGNQNGTVVTSIHEENDKTILDGFTITNGSGTVVEVDNNFNTPFYINCSTTTLPTIYSYGGGLCIAGGSKIHVRNCVVIYNTADLGAGMTIGHAGTFPTLFNTLVVCNEAMGDYAQGGGINCQNYAKANIINTTISGNQAEGDMSGSGGGMYCFLNVEIDISNSIIWDNQATHDSPEINLGVSSYPNTMTFSYSDVMGGEPPTSYFTIGDSSVVVWGDGMLGSDLQKHDPLFIDGADGEYYLSQTDAGNPTDSPCVDAGDPSSILVFGSTRVDKIADLGNSITNPWDDINIVDMGFHYDAKYYDQNKLYFDPGVGVFSLCYDDISSPFTMHNPGELFDPSSLVYSTDESCFMATACNLLAANGYFNSNNDYFYLDWLFNGSATSPKPDGWSGTMHFANAGNMFTFDDGGWINWCFDDLGLQYEMDVEVPHHLGNFWWRNPRKWCQKKLEEGKPVGLGIAPRRQDSPLHNITLWEINKFRNTILITDSDDRTFGVKQYTYDEILFGKRWVINNYKDRPGNDWRIVYVIALD